MSKHTMDTILDQCHSLPYDGYYLDIVGRGEPTMHAHFDEICQSIIDNKPPGVIARLTTNGKRFDKYKDLIIQAFDNIIYDVYSDNLSDFDNAVSKLQDAPLDLSINLLNHHGKCIKQYRDGKVTSGETFLLHNRAGIFEIPLVTLKPLGYGYCHRPFDDIQLNWNGDYQLCCEIWTDDSLGNIFEESLFEYWLHNINLNNYRDQLNTDIRPSPCDKCDYPGNKNHAKRWKRNELSDEWKDNIKERLKLISELPNN